MLVALKNAKTSPRSSRRAPDDFKGEIQALEVVKVVHRTGKNTLMGITNANRGTRCVHVKIRRTTMPPISARCLQQMLFSITGRSSKSSSGRPALAVLRYFVWLCGHFRIFIVIVVDNGMELTSLSANYSASNIQTLMYTVYLKMS